MTSGSRVRPANSAGRGLKPKKRCSGLTHPGVRPANSAGRGLKPWFLHPGRSGERVRPANSAGRGLKQGNGKEPYPEDFVRPANSAGRGLKHIHLALAFGLHGSPREFSGARIETSAISSCARTFRRSPREFSGARIETRVFPHRFNVLQKFAPRIQRGAD